jgi:hypothetical protein
MTTIIYSNQKTAFEPGYRYSNPRLFAGVRPGVTKVIIVGEWPKVEQAYRAAGIEIERRGKDAPPVTLFPQAAAGAAEPATIPANFNDLEWPELRLVAMQPGVSNAPVINRVQAIAAIEAYIEREGLVLNAEQGERPDDAEAGDAEAGFEEETGDETELEEVAKAPEEMTDGELRAAIEAKTGKAPHRMTGRKKLLAAYAKAVAEAGE